MTADAPVRCPLCAAALSRTPSRCPSCDAPVGGDTGRRLLALDRRLARMTDERRDLLARLRHETSALIAADRGTVADVASTGAREPRAVVGVAAGGTGARSAREPVARLASTFAPLRAWLADAGPQTLLAAGGVLLLIVAAGAFLAVTWRDLSVPVRGGVVVAAAAASGWLTAGLVGRGLARTAEATGVLTLALLAVLADGLWRAGLLDALGRDLGVLAQVSAVLAVTAHTFARASGVRSPLVLAAWLAGTAVHAAGAWLVDPYAVGATRLDLVLSQAVNVTAVCMVGVYAARVLTVVPRWRLVTLGAAAVLWTVATAVVVAVLASLVPAAPSDRVAFGVGLTAAAASVAVAAAARRIGGPLSRWWPAVGTGGMWCAGTLTGAGALAGRSAVWPDMPALLPLSVGVALLTRVRPGLERRSALLGMAPLALLALRPVVGTAQWVASATPVPAPTGSHVVRLASCLVVCLLAGAVGMLVRRARIPALAMSAGSWVVAVVGGGLVLASLAPSQPTDLPPFLGAAAVVAGAVALAVLARRAGGATAVWWPAGVVLALTAGAAGALAGRMAALPHLPVVVPLAVAAALVWTRRDGERLAAAIGAGPVMLATMWPALRTVGRLGGILVHPAPVPDVVETASLTVTCALALTIATAVHRVARGDAAHGGPGPDAGAARRFWEHRHASHARWRSPWQPSRGRSHPSRWPPIWPRWRRHGRARSHRSSRRPRSPSHSPAWRRPLRASAWSRRRWRPAVGRSWPRPPRRRPRGDGSPRGRNCRPWRRRRSARRWCGRRAAAPCSGAC
ncbi:MAG TPA: hypothetical protein VFZ70_06260 [Euzebyales bacterium]